MAYSKNAVRKLHMNDAAVPQALPQRRAVVRRLPVRQKRKKPQSRNAALFKRGVIAVGILFLLCFNIYSRVEISETQNAIADCNEQLEMLDSESVRIEMEPENKVSYENLEEQAQALGMKKKSKTQVKYIDSSGEDSVQILSD